MIIEAIAKDENNPFYRHTYAVILGGMGRWKESLVIARHFIENGGFVKKEIKEVTEYFINAAAGGYADEAITALEEYQDNPSLEPIIAGLKIFIGQEVLTAQEIMEIGHDVAQRIKDRMSRNKEGHQ